MLSTPTTRAMSVLPSMMLWLAISRALMPEAQFWLTLAALLVTGRPTAMATCRAGREPCIWGYTSPMTISFTMSALIPALSTAALPTVIARSLADLSFRLPMNLAIGVLHALTITTSLSSNFDTSNNLYYLHLNSAFLFSIKALMP